MEHFLLFVVAAFLLYYLTNGCCNGVIDGFSVGGESCIYGFGDDCCINCCGEGNTASPCKGDEHGRGSIDPKNIHANTCKKLDKINTKVDTLTKNLDELICQLVQSEKCITDKGVSDCK